MFLQLIEEQKKKSSKETNSEIVTAYLTKRKETMTQQLPAGNEGGCSKSNNYKVSFTLLSLVRLLETVYTFNLQSQTVIYFVTKVNLIPL